MAGRIKSISAAGLLLLVDQTAKFYTEKKIKDKEEKRLGSKIIIRKVYNKGACMNFLDKYPGLVRALSFLLSLILSLRQIWFSGKKGRSMEKVGLALLTGGAWSNTMDRCTRGYVVDYAAIESKNKEIRRITFNLADIFIFAGSILMVLFSGTCILNPMRYNKTEREQEKDT